MHVLVTGGTGYVGRAIVRTLARAGHAPVVFARAASRSGLPGRADRWRRPRPRGDRPRGRGRGRRLPRGGAREHLASAARGLRRGQRRRVSECDRGVPGTRPRQADLHIVFSRAAAGGSRRDHRRQRLSAHQGRGARARAGGGRTGHPDRVDAARRHLRTWRGDRGQSRGPARRRSSRGTAARCHRRRPSVVVRLRRGCGGRARGGAHEGRAGPRVSTRGRERPADAPVRDPSPDSRNAPAPPHPIWHRDGARLRRGGPGGARQAGRRF